MRSCGERDESDDPEPKRRSETIGGEGVPRPVVSGPVAGGSGEGRERARSNRASTAPSTAESMGSLRMSVSAATGMLLLIPPPCQIITRLSSLSIAVCTIRRDIHSTGAAGSSCATGQLKQTREY